MTLIDFLNCTKPYRTYIGAGFGVVMTWSIVKLCLVAFFYHYTPSISWVILPIAYLLPKACVSIAAAYLYFFSPKNIS